MFFICFFSRFINCFGPCALPRLTMSAYQFTFTHCYFHARQRNSCNWRFSKQNMGELGYAISSWSANAGYSASMLTKGAKVDRSLTRQLWAPSVNISAAYPTLPDHDSMNNPSVLSQISKSTLGWESIVQKNCWSENKSRQSFSTCIAIMW